MEKIHRVLIQVGIAALVLGIVSYLFLDKTVAVAASHLSHQSFVFRLGSLIDIYTGSKQMIYIEVIIGAIACWFLLTERPKPADRYARVFLSAFFAYVVTFSIKMVVARYRPEYLLSDQFYGFTWFNTGHGLTSMPSGHATVNFVLAISIAIFLCAKHRFFGVLLILYSIVVAISRVVINEHYVSDVLVALTVATWSIAYVINIQGKR